jgi:hypothetical protein
MCLDRGVSAGMASRRKVDAMVRTLKRYPFRPAALLGFSLLWALFPAHASEIPSAAAPHVHFQNPDACPKCHVLAQGVLAPDRYIPESTGFCLGCHRKESMGRSHPLDVGRRGENPPMKIPDDFRLSIDGRLMCLSCHAAHGPYLSANPSFPDQAPYTPGEGGRAAYKTYYLRRTHPREGFAALCAACHANR